MNIDKSKKYQRFIIPIGALFTLVVLYFIVSYLFLDKYLIQNSYKKVKLPTELGLVQTGAEWHNFLTPLTGSEGDGGNDWTYTYAMPANSNALIVMNNYLSNEGFTAKQTDLAHGPIITDNKKLHLELVIEYMIPDDLSENPGTQANSKAELIVGASRI